LMSTYDIEKQLNDAVLAEAEAAAPQSGYNTQTFYTLQTDGQGNVDLVTVDNSNLNIDDSNTADATNKNPVKSGYQGYLVGNGYPPNGVPYGFGIHFPENAAEGDFFLRTDYLPNRLFRYDGSRWVKFEDKVRMTKTQTDNRSVQKTSFINNSSYTNFTSLYTDTFTVSIPKVFRTEDFTQAIDIVAKKIITKVTYNAKYGVEVFVNQYNMPVSSQLNEGGNFAFTTEWPLSVGDTVTWTIYSERVAQRVSLSNALRPKADL